MKFEDKELATSFEIPDPFTYREAMKYDSAVDFSNEPLYPRLWGGVVAVAQNWQSEHIPELNAEILDDEINGNAYDVIKWASLALFSHVKGLKEVPKN